MRAITPILISVAVLVIVDFAIWQYRTGNLSDRIIAECEHAQYKEVCYTDRISEVLKQHGISAAFDVLAAAYDKDPGFAGTCHAETHEIGKAAYKEFHTTGRAELTSKASYCGYGFYHGFMDALFVDTNNPEEARAFCTYIGKNVPHPPPPEFAEGSCYHGIGHGITDGTDPRLWGDALSIVRPGLALCARVAGTNDMWHSRCVSGVFNALGNMYLDPKYKLDPGTNPYTFCANHAFTPLERETCYDQMNTQAAVLGHNSLKAIVGFVNTIQDLHYRSVALHEAVSYYIQILKLSQKSLSPEEATVCELPTAELKESCMSGFVGGIFELGLPDQQYKEALQLCNADTLPADLRPLCFSALLVNSTYYYTADIVRKICQNVPQEYRGSQCPS